MAVTDLTNTKWLINSTTCTAGYGTFQIDFDRDEWGTYEDFYIGYGGNPDGPYPLANSVNIQPAGPDFLQVNDIITITGGTDVTNANLISWLTANATQITTGGSMYLGTSSISKMYIGQDEVEKIYFGQDLVYEKQASLPTFTGTDIGAHVYGPYQFEQGMTFAQWVASAYNTDGWIVSSNMIELNGFKYLMQDTITYVKPTDLVEAKEYIVLLDN